MVEITIKKGYKQTEIGVIPEDWDIVSFKKIADKNKKWSITGGPFGSNLKKSDYTNDGVQIIQLQNIGDGRFIDDYQIFTSKDKADELLSCNIYPNEIILSKMGDPVARACFVPEKNERYLMASDGIRLVVNENEFSKKFIHDYINSAYFRNRAFEVSMGSTRLRIGLPKLKGLSVVKPPKEEQDLIATILSDTDALINHLDKLITKKKAIKQGTIQQLLTGKKRLPGFSGEWEENKLVKIADFFKGRGLSKSKIENNGQYSCILYGELFTTYARVIDEVKSKTNFTEGLTSTEGDILMPGSTTTVGIDLAVASVLNKNDVLIGGDVIVIRKKKQEFYNPNFLANYLTHVSKYKIAGITQGITIIHLHGSRLQEIMVKIPKDVSEQTAIATILSDMDKEIELIEHKRDKYIMLKNGMMQQLLTGAIRIYGNK